jgi:hypothetical protein
MLKKNWVRWTIAIVIFLGSAVYQRLTGPTFPVRGKIQMASETVRYRLSTSHGGPGDCPIALEVPDRSVTGTLSYVRLNSTDSWTEMSMRREGEYLVADLPHQPPAGKLVYKVTLKSGTTTMVIPPGEPVVIRFKGAVPTPVLYIHIFFMSVAMIFANRTGLEALVADGKTRSLVLWTMVTLFIGGLIFGPIVQKYAFGALWTGWPLGQDLTDNKTAVAFIFWLIAFIVGRKGKPARGWVITAALVTLAIYLIPHSVLGSELDYSTMQ